jgi:hypothetical protein
MQIWNSLMPYIRTILIFFILLIGISVLSWSSFFQTSNGGDDEVDMSCNIREIGTSIDGDFKVSIGYKSNYSILHKDIVDDTLVNSRSHMGNRRYLDQLYLILSCSKGEEDILSSIKNEGEYKGTLEYLHFGIINDIHVTTSGGKELMILGCNYIPTYGLGSSSQVMICISRDGIRIDDNVILVLNLQFFNKREYRFSIPYRDICAGKQVN